MVWSALRTCQAHHSCELEELCYKQHIMHNMHRSTASIAMLSSLMITKLWRQVHLQNSLGALQLAAEMYCDKSQDQWDASVTGKE